METQKQTNIPEWILKENEQLDQKTTFTGERLPSLQFEENKIISFKVDITNPFGEYQDKVHKCVKAMIPVESNGVRKMFWLNKSNPLYKDIIRKIKEGQVSFKVIQTGKDALTGYNLVEDY